MQNGKRLVIKPNQKLSCIYRLFGIILILVAALLILPLKAEGILAAIPLLAIGAIGAVNSPLTLKFDKTAGKFSYQQPYPIYETSNDYLMFKKKRGVYDLTCIKAIKHIHLGVYWFGKTYGLSLIHI